MYLFLATFCLLFLTPQGLNAFERNDGHFSIDNAVLRTCNNMIEKLNENVVLKRRLLYLIRKNEKLTKWTPKNKKSILKKLRYNNNELYFFISRIDKLIVAFQEKITRFYCPGIVLDDNPTNYQIEKIFSLEKEILEKALNNHYLQ